MMMGFVLNGMWYRSRQAGERLFMLRERLGAREVKIGCNAYCGACSVLVDGGGRAWLMAAHQAAGKRVETVRGLLDCAQGRALVVSFQDHQAAQRDLHADDGVGGGIAA